MKKKKVIVFSGAGVSAESGLGTFRDSGGMWEKYDIHKIATPEAWEKDPALVTEFYNLRRKQCYESSPNAAHKAIAELEKQYDVTVVTQNIDNLHERAGSTNVLHLHGEINKVKSSGPKADDYIVEQPHWEVKMGEKCPNGYQLRPHVVWFGEGVPMMEKAVEAIQQAAILIVVGTSLVVYPAAGLIHYAPKEAQAYLIDPKQVEAPNHFEVIQETASVGVVQLVEKLLGKF